MPRGYDYVNHQTNRRKEKLVARFLTRASIRLAYRSDSLIAKQESLSCGTNSGDRSLLGPVSVTIRLDRGNIQPDVNRKGSIATRNEEKTFAIIILFREFLIFLRI